MIFTVQVTVSLKPVINDPQGISISKALKQLGFEGVEGVRAGKSFAIRLKAENKYQAGKEIEKMCQKLLANPVLEVYSFRINRS